MKAVLKAKYPLGLMMMVLLMSLFSAQAALPAPIEKNILILHQFASQYPAHQAFNEEFVQTLGQETGYKFNYSYEYLNLEKFAQHDDYLKATAAYIKLKQQYTNWTPDVIVASGGANDFLSRFSQELFGEVPIVSVWSADESRPVDVSPKHVLITALPNFDSNIRLILSTQKNLKKIYVVVGDSYSEQAIPAQIKQAAEPYLAQAEFIYLNELSYADMMITLAQVPDDSAILFVRWVADAKGESFVPVRVLSAITKAVKAPVYGTQRQYLGAGIIGGYLYNQGILGQTAALMTLRLINGEEPADLVVLDEQSHEYVFDDRALNRWHIDTKTLPQKSIILYQDEDIWSAYGIYFIVGTLIILLEMALIANLVKNYKRRMKAEQELHQLNHSLEKLVDGRTADLKEATVKLEELNNQLDFTSRVDYLTGLYNRRHMEEHLHQEHQLFLRTGQVFSIMIADIDDFKQTNDLFGHDAGDAVLTSLSDLFGQLIRSYDVLARWGGEEFMLLFPGLQPEDAPKRAETIRMAVQNHVQTYQKEDLNITITIGMATIKKDETVEALVKRADEALYEGKRTGKNKAVMSG